MPSARPTAGLDGLKTIIAKHWGFNSFRPLQEPVQTFLRQVLKTSKERVRSGR